MSFQIQAESILELRRRERDGSLSLPYRDFRRKFRKRPHHFIEQCINWKALPDEKPAFYQLEALEELAASGRVTLRGPHGLGKTALAAWATLWFALTNDEDFDWKIPVTASAWRQLTKFLFPEIHKWSHFLKWDKIGRQPFNSYRELKHLSLKLKTGEAFALASNNPELIEGAHGQKLFYIFDEAKAIPDPTWDSAEGAFSSGDAYWMAISTPGQPSGRFYQIHKREAGFEDWHPIHITPEMAIEAGRISAAWVEQRRKQWGEKSAAFITRVAGNFAGDDSSGVITLALVERSNELWQEWYDNKKRRAALIPSRISVDVARYGGDKTVIDTSGYEEETGYTVIMDVQDYDHTGTMETAGRVRALVDRLRDKETKKQTVKVIIDIIGIGAGVYDRVIEKDDDTLSIKAEAFNAAGKSKMLDRSEELGFLNRRAAGWWTVREMLEDEILLLPPLDLITGDLTAPTWKMHSGGRIQVESKDDIKKRIGRSTDYGDAIIQIVQIEPTGAGLV